EGGMGGESPVAEHCVNDRVDADETDRDCGGAACEPCDIGKSCRTHRDCQSVACIEATCQNPSCVDGAQNHGETDVDCGGDECGATCEPGDTCLDHEDCRSFHCKDRVCQAPACDDRILNGDESGTDCGGSCDRCPVGEPCVVPGDCETPLEGDPAVPECRDGVCALGCPDDTGDCNQRAADGCEVDLLTSSNHCGSCGSACEPEHATGECVGGECLIKTEEPNQGCDQNYANCN